MAFLVVSLGGEEVVRHELHGPAVIGRSVDADVSVRDASLSRWHCRVEPSEEGAGGSGWVVIDQGSRNGTTVNGRKVTRHLLHHGDLLRVGRVTVYFSTEAFRPAEVVRLSHPSEPRLLAPEMVSADPRERFSQPLLVPATRLPRPLPGEAPSPKPLYESVDILSSPGWSRQLRTMPSPSIDESSVKANTLDLNQVNEKKDADQPTFWGKVKNLFGR